MESIEQVNYIKASIETVYQVLTSEEGLGNIWTKKLNVKPEIGFVNEFDFDEGYITKFRIVDLVENNRIVWECIASDKEWVGTKVSFELSEKDKVTTIKLKHFDWRACTEYYGWCSYNWAMFLFRLKHYIEN